MYAIRCAEMPKNAKGARCARALRSIRPDLDCLSPGTVRGCCPGVLYQALQPGYSYTASLDSRPDSCGPSANRLLSVAARAAISMSVAARALSISGGLTVLAQTVLRGHPAGAIGVSGGHVWSSSTAQSEKAARQPAVRCTLMAGRSRPVRSKFTENVANISGGALQVIDKPH
jgi:hypothetical protein